MIYGSYETSVAQNFQAVFELCDEEKNKENPETASIVCANQTEVNEWMSFKYIMAVEQNKNFIQHKFGEQRFEFSAEAQWYPINPEQKEDYVNRYTRATVELSDNFFSIGNYFIETDEGFKNTRLPTRGIPYNNKYQNIVTYEVSTTHNRYFRSVYSILDFLSEMGGLFTAFGSFCFLIINALNHYGSYQYLMAESFYSR